MTATPDTTRRRIQLLPDAMINKIAAGEVVERPASVVKELLDNAVDSGADRITIAIQDGGKTLIRITDNGVGIPPEEVPLAFAQHATSKILEADDLFAISTMGFRGEALASIASISHATLITRTVDHPTGVKIEVRDSVLSPIIPAAAPVGTTIEVRDLFYSIPARRKFLRGDSAELGHIHEMVLRTALAHPHIALGLTHNGRQTLDFPATTDWRLRIANCLGDELRDSLLPINFSERGITIRGFVGKPETARSTARYQYLFLNRRYIRDRSLLFAIKEAFRGLVEPTAQPIAAIFIEMDPTTFDVNVHPQKIEVRFRDTGGPYRSVLAAVRETLLSSDLTPNIRIPGTASAFRPTPQPALDHPPTSIDETRQVIADFFRAQPNATPRLDFPPPSAQPTDDPQSQTNSTPSPNAPQQAATTADTAHDITRQPPTPNTPFTDSPTTDFPLPNSQSPPARFIQLHNTYLVLQTPDGITLFDQHALHERILYEELFHRIARGQLESQRLLLPEIFSITPRQLAALEQASALLEKMGIEITPLDGRSIAIQSFPNLLHRINPREFLQQLLDRLADVGANLTQEELLHELLDMASCKAAVKANDPLSDDEIRSLLDRRTLIERSSNCPHGRPTTLHLSIHELEKQFKRR